MTMIMKRAILVLACVSALALSAGGSLGAQALEPIRYTLRFPAPHTHYVEVEATVPTAGRPDVEVYMATWTPGSYLIREYERNVEAVTAGAGARALAVEKSEKNRWKITTGGAASVTLRYKVYSREMTVRNNWVEAGFAMINGAPTFLTLVERAARPHEVRIELPASWKGVQTPLMPVAGAANAFRAEDFDTIVDSPIIIGNPVVREFTVDGKKHALVLEGDPSLFDADRAAADVKKIVEAGRDVMGPLLYPHYYFLNMIVEAGRRARAQEQLPRHGRPLHHAHAPRLHGMARPDRARVLPQLERQADAAARARPVRLRERKLREDAVGGRRLHRLLRGAFCRAAPRSRPGTNFSTSSRIRSRRCRPRPAGWSRRSTWRRTTRGSSCIAPTKTPPTSA